MQGTTLAEWRKLGDVKTSTIKYLEESRVSARVDCAARILADEEKPLSTVKIAEISE